MLTAQLSVHSSLRDVVNTLGVQGCKPSRLNSGSLSTHIWSSRF
ncbi:hypothetical protein B5V00_14625 [Geothermobacter hydrogeniphilus]|uniref:Uncharacterized protein n=1 Tax=Geothermobacter hydrogeniphilus TaxID=1969733 RepID=A0A1X0XSL3_9BACT|nr:hypothetical protein B5V00_14625 [Geothermobacter hydrogeniphilus]